MSENSHQQEKRYKKKRKKSLLVNARKYGKKGCYGRGSQLDADTYKYFVGVLETYKEGFPNDEEKSLFVDNAFEQTKGQEINYSSNQLACRVIQTLLPFASNEVLERYAKAFVADLRPLCSDRFASHVLQTLLDESCRRGLQDSDEEFKENCQTFVMKVSKFLLNNLEDYLWDTYGSHIIRTALKNLSMQSYEEEVPEKYKEVVKDYAERLIAWPQFKDLPYSEVSSGCLQVLSRALAKVDVKQLKAYVKKLLNESFASVVEAEEDNKEKTASSKLPDVFMSTPAVVLLETVLEVAPPKLYTQIYAKCYINHLAQLATTRSTNFCVQKLISNCKEKVEFEAIFDELSDHFKDILDAGHSGVILALAQSCKHLKAKQGSFVQNIMKVYDCFEPEDNQNSIVLCLSQGVAYKNVAEVTENLKLNLHGTLIVQLMLDFNKPIKIINSILSISDHNLKELFSNSMGNHIVDSYMKSEFVGEKSREKLIRKLQGSYQALAGSKYGSRSFEAVWNAASLKYKLNIMKELSNKDGAWSNSKFGHIIASKINLVLYKRNIEEWKNTLNKTSKTKALFADIIEK